MSKIKQALENEIIALYENDFMSPEEIAIMVNCDIDFVLDTLDEGGQI